jgi:hypothetical protein
MDKVKKVFIRRTFDSETNGRGTSDGNTEEVVFDGEQELLKRVYERKKELLDTNMGNNRETFYDPTIIYPK